MKIKTTRFGDIEVGDEKIINMPLGMLGFPENRQYVFIQHKEASPVFWFQSAEDPGLAFAITSPFLFKPDYEVDLMDVLKEMSWHEEKIGKDLALYVVLNVPKGSPHEMTANLVGPIVVNNKTRQAIQVVITDTSYSHKFPLMRGNDGDTDL